MKAIAVAGVGALVATTAAADELDREAIEERPRTRPSDLLRHVPLLVGGHIAGGGPADRYLVRGLDAGYGRDLAVMVDGVPINRPGHVLGHGYADTHFVIPETVDAIELDLGSYDARDGDFTTAGTLAIRTIERVPGDVHVRATSGSQIARRSWNLMRQPDYRVVGMASPALGATRVLGAIAIDATHSPYLDGQHMQRGALLGTLRRPVAGGELAIATTLHVAWWGDPGFVPVTEVDAGRIEAHGSIDPTQAGSTTRGSASATWDDGDRWNVGGYAIVSNDRAFANHTLFLRDLVDGDQVELVDRRVAFGAAASYRRRRDIAGREGRVRAGIEGRIDAATVEVWHAARRHRSADCFGVAPNPCSSAGLRIVDLAVHADYDVAITSRVRATAGIRVDQLVWDVDGEGSDVAVRPSPKLGAMWSATRDVDVRVAGGLGFRSTDARAALIGEPAPRTVAAEVGVQIRPGRRLSVDAALWYGALGGTTAWRADRGDMVAERRLLRGGFDAAVELDLGWLALDAAIAVARGELGTDAYVPLAPRLVGSGGAAIRRGASFVSLRAVGLGARAATHTQLADGHVVVGAVAGTRWRVLDLGLVVDNLLDQRWWDVQIVGDYRADRDGEPAYGVLATPGIPLVAMVTVGYAP